MSRYDWERGATWDNPYASVREGSAPIRVVTNEHDPEFKANPVGFAPIGDWPKRPTLRETLFGRHRR